jgi:hypothetical protein
MEAWIAREVERKRVNELRRKWAPWEGTPETNERIAKVPERQRQSALSRMAKLGTISADELAAAHEIARIVEMIEGDVSVRSASLEARVDCSGSSRDILVESLGRIRAEVAYSAWCEVIPMPRQMIIDMVVRDQSYRAITNSYGINWRTARKRLITALRLWDRVRLEARNKVTDETVADIYQRLGEGMLLAPKPKEAA